MILSVTTQTGCHLFGPAPESIHLLQAIPERDFLKFVWGDGPQFFAFPLIEFSCKGLKNVGRDILRDAVKFLTFFLTPLGASPASPNSSLKDSGVCTEVIAAHMKSLLISGPGRIIQPGVYLAPLK